MAAIETEQRVTLKLMVNEERNKVFYAEAGKDFVDILFSFLTLPLGTIAGLVSEVSNMQPVVVGSLSSLYRSVKFLDQECLCTYDTRIMLLQPAKSLEAYHMNLKLNIDETEPPEYFICDNLVRCRHNSPVSVSTSKKIRCRCGEMLSVPISPESSNGFVNSDATFMITDDLKVVPDSLDVIFFLLRNYGIENVSSLNEMIVTITEDQIDLSFVHVMDLLKSCLLSKTTLTDTFLDKKPCFYRLGNIEFPPFDFSACGNVKIDVKIMQSKSNGKILYAQGNEDFADFLFSFLTFPLGRVVRLMDGRSFMGSVDGLYKSIIDLDEDYWITNEVKNKLVDPELSPQIKLSNQLLLFYDNPEYFCNTEHKYNHDNTYSGRTELTAWYLTSTFRKVDQSRGTCTAVKFVDSTFESEKSKGYVKGPTMYMATDDLIVTPISSICVLSLLKRMSIFLSDLEEKVVSIGVKEGVSILQASLTSSSALTTGLSHLLNKVME